MLVSVIATDDWRGRAAGGGHSEGVIDTVPWGQDVTDIRRWSPLTYEGPVCGGAGHTGAGAPTGEGWSQLK